MKILHIVRQFYPMIGGIENYVLNLASTQVLHGHHVTVITLNRDFITGNKLPGFHRLDNGIEIIRIPYLFSNKYPIAFGVIKYIKPFDIINIHAIDFFIDFLGITKFIHRKKLVLITHGGYFHTNWGRWLKKIYFRTITRFITNYCVDGIIGCSENDIRIFREITSKIKLVENGVNIEPYLNTTKEHKRGSLLFVGRLDHNKRIDNIIKLIAGLNENGERVKLIIAGPDWKNISAELKLLAEKLNVDKNIIFRGVIDNTELKKLYSDAFIFVSASDYEGFGITAIEAMASGTLCALSNIPSFEKFLYQKPFGVICNFSNIEETISKVSTLLEIDDSRYEKLSFEAREYSKNYSWAKVIKQFNEIYNSIGIENKTLKSTAKKPTSLISISKSRVFEKRKDFNDSNTTNTSS